MSDDPGLITIRTLLLLVVALPAAGANADGPRPADHSETPITPSSVVHTSLVPALPNQSAAVESSAVSNNIVLPSRTVVGLGLGFVAAALCIVGVTVLIRAYQVHRAVRRARAQGETVTFRQMWSRWGGWVGMLFSPAEEAVHRFKIKVRKVARPEVWDTKISEGKYEFEEADQPLAAVFCGKEQRLSIAVLVLMPSPLLPPPPLLLPEASSSTQPPRPPDADPEEAELPPVMLGTAYIPTHNLDGFELEEKDDVVMEQIVEVELLPTWRPAPQPAPAYFGGSTPWAGQPIRPGR